MCVLNFRMDLQIPLIFIFEVIIDILLQVPSMVYNCKLSPWNFDHAFQINYSFLQSLSILRKVDTQISVFSNCVLKFANPFSQEFCLVLSSLSILNLVNF